MNRRPSILLSLSALVALGLLSACDGKTGSSVGGPDPGMSPTSATAADARSQSDVTADWGPTEFEGTVTAVLILNPQGQSRFMIGGRQVIINPPSYTHVFVNGGRGSVLDVTVGRRAHVKGNMVGRPTPAISASEVRVSTGGSVSQATCAAPGASVEIEGLVSSKGASSVTVSQQGRASMVCLVSSTTSIRKGNKGSSLGALQSGWRVHVKGTSQGASGQACTVAAREIKVQNQN
jgi:Domain of unknown function (DUF5666)